MIQISNLLIDNNNNNNSNNRIKAEAVPNPILLSLKQICNNVMFLIKPCFIIPNIRCRYTSQQTLFFRFVMKMLHSTLTSCGRVWYYRHVPENGQQL